MDSCLFQRTISSDIDGEVIDIFLSFSKNHLSCYNTPIATMQTIPSHSAKTSHIIWVNYNISLTWIKAVIIYPDIIINTKYEILVGR
jgi:hypothetical protein